MFINGFVYIQISQLIAQFIGELFVLFIKWMVSLDIMWQAELTHNPLKIMDISFCKKFRITIKQ